MRGCIIILYIEFIAAACKSDYNLNLEFYDIIYKVM